MSDIIFGASAWRKSSFSASGDCLEAATRGGAVLIRDSKRPGKENLSFSSSTWQKFTQTVRSGEII